MGGTARPVQNGKDRPRLLNITNYWNFIIFSKRLLRPERSFGDHTVSHGDE